MVKVRQRKCKTRKQRASFIQVKAAGGNKRRNPREQKLNYTNQDNTRTQAANEGKKKLQE